MAHRKASTRTPQPQDKPKEGECPDETNIVIFALEVLLFLFLNDYLVFRPFYLYYEIQHRISHFVCAILITI